eukprot:gene6087-7308_t
MLLACLTREVYPEKAGFTLELTAENFNSTISQVTSSAYVLVEYFAPWCPHCQRFKPQYERVAALFNAEPKPAPEVLVANVDCVAQATLCKRFDIKSYPTMLFGHPENFAGDGKHAAKVPHKENSAEGMLKWLNERLGQNHQLSTDTTYGHTYNELGEGLKESPPERGKSPAPAVFNTRVDLPDVEKATILSFEYMFTGELVVAHNRRPFVEWVQLLAKTHPLPRCRAGSKSLLAELDVLWPRYNGSTPSPRLRTWRVCGKQADALREWGSCKGSLSVTRGYSCGLWMLFHTLAAHSAADGGAMWMEGVRSFVSAFFNCNECRTHFLEQATTEDAKKVQTKRDAVMWMWATHNN